MKIFWRYGRMVTDEGKKVEIFPSRNQDMPPKITIGGTRVGDEERKKVLEVVLENYWTKSVKKNKWLVVVNNKLYTITTGYKWKIMNATIESLTYVVEGDEYIDTKDLPEL